VVKLTMPASAIARLSAEVARLGGEAVSQAVGIMMARLPDADAVQRLRDVIAADREGALTVLRGPDGWGALPSAGDAAPLMRAIKRQFDAKGTLNPGVVVGG
jgi:FAD/FMN-containing dehydrogenase